jgi:hypothetical protein
MCCCFMAQLTAVLHGTPKSVRWSVLASQAAVLLSSRHKKSQHAVRKASDSVESARTQAGPAAVHLDQSKCQRTRYGGVQIWWGPNMVGSRYGRVLVQAEQNTQHHQSFASTSHNGQACVTQCLLAEVPLTISSAQQPALCRAAACCPLPCCAVLCCAVLQLVDLGCGYGGTALYIAQQLSCNAVGVNISPFQVGTRGQVQAFTGHNIHASAIAFGSAHMCHLPSSRRDDCIMTVLPWFQACDSPHPTPSNMTVLPASPHPRGLVPPPNTHTTHRFRRPMS